jgi:hypothetical protein
MCLTKNCRCIRRAIFLIFTAIVLVMTGCGGKPSASTTISSNLTTFSTKDGQILHTAYSDYDNLKKTSSPAEARMRYNQKVWK